MFVCRLIQPNEVGPYDDEVTLECVAWNLVCQYSKFRRYDPGWVNAQSAFYAMSGGKNVRMSYEGAGC